MNTPLTLASPEAMACPFDIYDQMRAESPAYHDAVTGMYVVTRYQDIRQVTADTATFSSKIDTSVFGSSSVAEEIEKMNAAAGFPRTETLVSLDPPRHREYRSLVDNVFSLNRVRAAEPRIADLVDRLIDDFPRDPFDFCARFAVPLPVTMIADQLGLPDDRLADFKRWSDASVDRVTVGRSPAEQMSGAQTILEMRQFFALEIERARQSPTNSLLSDLANTRTDSGALMGVNELTVLLQLLLAAGNETTTHAAGSAMLRLAQDHDLQQQLRENPAQIPAFIEEVLRLDSPIQGLFRIATRDTRIGDVPIPANSIINIRFAAGNRDPAQFACPAQLDITRGRQSHLAFGSGVHFCVGSQLARAELRIAFEKLLARSSAIRLTNSPDAVTRIPHFVAYGPRTLVIEFDRAS